MKKIITTIFLSATLLVANAQNDIVKLNLFSLALTNISLQYEHSFTTHSSAALGFSVLPSRSLPSFAYDDTDSSYDAGTIKFSGWSITPEYRYYFTNKGPKGFYAAPYFRYAKYKMEGFGVGYASVSGGPNDKTAVASGEIKNTLVGLMFGAQWLLGEHFALDWWILGAGFGSQKGTFQASGDFSPDDQTDITQNVNDISVSGIDLSVAVTNHNIKIDYKSTIPAIRGFGLCLGYRF